MLARAFWPATLPRGKRPGAAPSPAGIVHFATDSIAAKPVKPCDGGVFRAFYLLLKKERRARNPIAPPRLRFGLCHSGAAVGLPLLFGCRCCLAALALALRRRTQKPLAARGTRGFRYCFNSGKAPETVRWRRFLGG